ncbi:hypothetical protein PENSPDRAFT_648058 [Peniophora sp. CONT]|nr:hypothetical protein PENSPDRAFT_648058 [Peniophora sp. CONT]
MSVDVIDISSSPESLPRPGPSRIRHRTPLFLPDEPDHIDLTTDDEFEVFPDFRAAKRRRSDTVGMFTAGASQPPARRKSPTRTLSPIPPRSRSPNRRQLSHSLDVDDWKPAPIDVDELEAVPQLGRLQLDGEDLWLAQVCEMIPDVSPDHVRALLDQHKAAYPNDIVNFVVHTLLESKSYPKLEKGKGKAKSSTPDEIDYASTTRNIQYSRSYYTLAKTQLLEDFPDASEAYIAAAYDRHQKLYAPTYLYLDEEQRAGSLPVGKRKSANKKGKGKSVSEDADFLMELSWLQEKLRRDAEERDATMAQELLQADEIADIECGCCFDSYPFSKVVQCPEAHLFCADCVVGFAESKLGEQNHLIPCMSSAGDGCKAHFGDSELRRVLPPKTLELYERVRQRRDVEMAGLDDMEECPFCDFKMIFEVDADTDKLFRCQNPECEQISCRKCKKIDHLPKTCAEVDEDKKLEGRHAVEEAMTAALMRNCPKCKKAFIKESGCNKMVCPYCTTLSCYVCRQIVTGYEHFNRGTPGQVHATGAQMNGACPLWDAVEQRHHDEVAEAAKKAREAYKEDHPDAEETDLQVDLPPPPKPGQLVPGMPGYPGAAVHPAFPRMPAMAMGPAAAAAGFQARHQEIMQRMQQQQAQLHAHAHALFDPFDDDPLFGAALRRRALPRALPVPPRAPVPPPVPRTRAQVAAAARVPVAGPARPRKRKR